MIKVYLIRNGEGMYKVGRTEQRVNERIKQLQTGSSTVIYEVDECEVIHGSKVESYLHRKYKRLGYHQVGEWFNLPEDVAENFRKDAQSADATFELLKNMGNPYI